MNLLKNLLSRTKKFNTSDPIRTSADLRNMMLHVKPDTLRIKSSSSTPNVWGVLMEFWLNQTMVTIVSLADGTTSMYFSTGGGNVGLGSYPEPSAASRRFIEEAERFMTEIPEVFACPMPKNGSVRFHLLTFAGYRSIEVIESEVLKESHRFFPLYEYGQDVISKIRIHLQKHAK